MLHIHVHIHGLRKGQYTWTNDDGACLATCMHDVPFKPTYLYPYMKMEHHSRQKVSIGGLNFWMEESNFQHVKDRDATVYERFNVGVSHSPPFLSGKGPNLVVAHVMQTSFHRVPRADLELGSGCHVKDQFARFVWSFATAVMSVLVKTLVVESATTNASTTSTSIC